MFNKFMILINFNSDLNSSISQLELEISREDDCELSAIGTCCLL